MSDDGAFDSDDLEGPAKALAEGRLAEAVSGLVGVGVGAYLGPAAGGTAAGLAHVGLARLAVTTGTERFEVEKARLKGLDEQAAFCKRAIAEALRAHAAQWERAAVLDRSQMAEHLELLGRQQHEQFEALLEQGAEGHGTTHTLLAGVLQQLEARRAVEVKGHLITGSGNTIINGDVHLSLQSPGDRRQLVDALIQSHQSELAAKDAMLGAQKAEVDSLRDALNQALSALARAQDATVRPPGIDEAVAEVKRGNTGTAERLFKRLAEEKEAEGAQANREAAVAYRHLGAMAFLHDTPAALAAYSKAVERDPSNAEGWHQLGTLLLRVGDLEEAQKAFDHVISLAGEDRRVKGAALASLGSAAKARGDLVGAEKLYAEALPLSEAHGHELGVAAILGNLGLLAKARGDLVGAEKLYMEALRLSDESGVAATHGNLGVLHELRGNLDGAEKSYMEALKLNEALGRKEGIATNLTGLGNIAQARGNLDGAEKLYKKALKLNEAAGCKGGIAVSLCNLGGIAQWKGDLGAAEKSYKEALKADEAMGNKEGIAVDLFNLGCVAQMRGELECARARWLQTLALCKETWDVRMAVEVQRLLDDLDK